MNNLNSVLVEGSMVEAPELCVLANKMPHCEFRIKSHRYYKDNGVITKEVSFFDVECDAKLAENVIALGKSGRNLRIVGRLKQKRGSGVDGNTYDKIIVIADHIEFRPELKSAEAFENETVNN